MAIALPEAYIDAHVDTGFEIVVRNALGYGDYLLAIPPNYIQAHILAYRALTKIRPDQAEPEIDI